MFVLWSIDVVIGWLLVLPEFVCIFFFKQKTAYEMRISDWSSDVCSSDLGRYRSAPAAKRSSCNRPGRPRRPDNGGSPQYRTARNDRASTAPDRPIRSEERRVGKACVSTCRSRR